MKKIGFIFCIVVIPLLMGLTAGTLVTNHILFDNFSMEINSDTANEIEFRHVGGEDISLNLGTSNTVALSSDSGVTTLDLGAASIVTGGTSITGEGTGAIYGFYQEVEHINADTTLTTAQSGKTIIVDGNTVTVKLTLPSVGSTEDGVWYLICDCNETAASDVNVEPSDSDSINGTADGFTSDGADELPCNCIFIYDHTQTNWIAIPMELGDGTAAWDCDS